MSLADAFLQAILADPDDDTPRLVFADWLEERGDPRGEFIRLQCELARSVADVGRYWELKQREQTLLQDHREEWSAPFASLVQGLEFARGFVDSITITLPDLLRHAHQLFSLSPIQEVRLRRPAGSHALGAPIQDLAALPDLARVSRLDLQGCGLRDAEVSILAASPHLHRLTTLVLSQNGLGNAGVQALAQSRTLGRLTTLDLSHNYFGDGGVQALAESLSFPRLTTLDLRHARITVAGAGQLLASPQLAWLSNLQLEGNPCLSSPNMRTLLPSLAQTPGPALLALVLQSRARPVQGRLAEQWSSLRAETPAALLTELQRGLHDSNWRVRAAAIQALAGRGSLAVPAVPGLVRRLHDANATVRDAAAWTLGRLVPVLPTAWGWWLCTLANPGQPPAENVRRALNSSQLPDSLVSTFTQVCIRRARWHATHAGLEPETGPPESAPPWLAAQEAADRAADAEVHREGRRTKVAALRARARTQEHAWQAACLLDLLRQHGELPHGTVLAEHWG